MLPWGQRLDPMRHATFLNVVVSMCTEESDSRQVSVRAIIRLGCRAVNGILNPAPDARAQM
jgi:hypothetical protein